MSVTLHNVVQLNALEPSGVNDSLNHQGGFKVVKILVLHRQLQILIPGARVIKHYSS